MDNGDIKKNNKIPGSCDTFTQPEEIKELSKFLGSLKKKYDESLTLDKTKEKVSEVKDINGLPDTMDILNGGKAISSLPTGLGGLDVKNKVEKTGKETLNEKSIGSLVDDIKRLGITDLRDIDRRIEKINSGSEVSIRGTRELLMEINSLKSIKSRLERLSPLDLRKLSSELTTLRGKQSVNLSKDAEKLNHEQVSKLNNSSDSLLDTNKVSLSEHKDSIQSDRIKGLREDLRTINPDQLRDLNESKEQITGDSPISLANDLEKLRQNQLDELGKEKETLLNSKEIELGKEKSTISSEKLNNLSEHKDSIQGKKVKNLREGLEIISPELIDRLHQDKSEINDERTNRLSEEKEHLKGKSLEELEKGKDSLTDKRSINLADSLQKLRHEQVSELEKDKDSLEDLNKVTLEENRYSIHSGELNELDDNLDTIVPKKVKELSEDKEIIRDLEELNIKWRSELLNVGENPELEDEIDKINSWETQELSNYLDTISSDDVDELSRDSEKINIEGNEKLSNGVIELSGTKKISELSNESETLVDDNESKLNDNLERLTDTRTPELNKSRENIISEQVENLPENKETIRFDREYKLELPEEKLDITEEKLKDLNQNLETLSDLDRYFELESERVKIKDPRLFTQKDIADDSSQIYTMSKEVEERLIDNRETELSKGKKRIRVDESPELSSDKENIYLDPEAKLNLDNNKESLVDERKLHELPNESETIEVDRSVTLPSETIEINNDINIKELPDNSEKIRQEKVIDTLEKSKSEIIDRREVSLRESDTLEKIENQGIMYDLIEEESKGNAGIVLGTLSKKEEISSDFAKKLHELPSDKESITDERVAKLETGKEEINSGDPVELSTKSEKIKDDRDDIQLVNDDPLSIRGKDINELEYQKEKISDIKEVGELKKELNEDEYLIDTKKVNELESEKESLTDDRIVRLSDEKVEITERKLDSLENKVVKPEKEANDEVILETDLVKNPDTTQWNSELETRKELNPNSTGWEEKLSETRIDNFVSEKGEFIELEDEKILNPNESHWDKSLEDEKILNPDTTDWETHLEREKLIAPDGHKDVNLEEQKIINPDTTEWDDSLEHKKLENPNQTRWDEKLSEYKDTNIVEEKATELPTTILENPDTTGWEKNLEDKKILNPNETGWGGILETEKLENPDTTGWSNELETKILRNPDETKWEGSLENEKLENPDTTEWKGELEDTKLRNPDETKWDGELEDTKLENPDTTRWEGKLEDKILENPDETKWDGNLEDKILENPDTTGWDESLEDKLISNPDETKWEGELEDKILENPDQTKWDGNLEDVKLENPDTTGWDNSLEDEQIKNPDITKWSGNLEDVKLENPDETKWDGNLEDEQLKNPDTTGWDEALEDYLLRKPSDESPENQSDHAQWTESDGLEDTQLKNPNETGWDGALEDYLLENPSDDSPKDQTDHAQWTESDGLEDTQLKNPDETGWDGALEDLLLSKPTHVTKEDLREHKVEGSADSLYTRSSYEGTTVWSELDSSPEGQTDHAQWTESDGLYTKESFEGTEVWSTADENTSGISNDEDWGSSDEFPTDHIKRSEHQEKISEARSFEVEVSGTPDDPGLYEKGAYEGSSIWSTPDENTSGISNDEDWSSSDEFPTDHLKRGEHQEKISDGRKFEVEVSGTPDDPGLYDEGSYAGTSIWSTPDENTSGISNDEDWTSQGDFPTDHIKRAEHESKISETRKFKVDASGTPDDPGLYEKSSYENTEVWSTPDENTSGISNDEDWSSQGDFPTDHIKRSEHQEKLSERESLVGVSGTPDAPELYEKGAYEGTYAWSEGDDNPKDQTDHAQWTEGDGLYSKESFVGTDAWSTVDESPENQIDHSQWTESDGLSTKIESRPKHEKKVNAGKNFIIDTQTTDEEIQGDDYENIPYEKSQYEKTVAWRLVDESPSGQPDHSQWTEEKGLYNSIANNNLNIYYNNLLSFIKDEERHVKMIGGSSGWYQQVGSLVSAYLSSDKVSQEDCKNFEEALFKTVIPSLIENPSAWKKEIIASSIAPKDQTDWKGNTSPTLYDDKETTPRYKLPEFNIGMIDPSAFIRFIAENTVGWIPGKKKGLGYLRKLLMDETIGALISARRLLERKVLKSNRDRLPGDDYGALSANSAKQLAKGVVSSLASALNGAAIDYSVPHNHPNNTKDITKGSIGSKEGTFDAMNVKGKAKETGRGGFWKRLGASLIGKNNGPTFNWKDSYLIEKGALVATLEDLSNFTKLPEGPEALKNIIRSPISYFTCADEYITNIQTLDSNSHWEILLRPWVGTSNGHKSYLPSIDLFNYLNQKEHGSLTYYSWKLPIISFEYSRAKTEQKSLPLFSGELSYPTGLEFINELRLTMVDDQFKTLRRYFENVSEVSCYYSRAHDADYYLDDGWTKDLSESEVYNHLHLVAPYKNIAFECIIHVLTPQLGRISKYSLLVVMKDFTTERGGDISGDAGDLTINFSVVGELPGKNDLDRNAGKNKSSDDPLTLKSPLVERSENAPNTGNNALGSALSNIASGGLAML